MYTTCSKLVVFMYLTVKSINNLLSYCVLIDPRISAFDKDLPVQNIRPQEQSRGQKIGRATWCHQCHPFPPGLAEVKLTVYLKEHSTSSMLKKLVCWHINQNIHAIERCTSEPKSLVKRRRTTDQKSGFCSKQMG